MSNIEALFPSVKEFIDFETLMEEAQQTLAALAAQSWSDTAEHDPGITLLQALAYNTSDLSYRSSLPLVDLLTPSPSNQAQQVGIFPEEFGPQQALTCGPISEEDYRRAILDLRSSESADGYFLFSNVQMVREPESERYQYWYDIAERQYSFTQPAEGQSQRFTLLGNYFLYLQPSRKAEAHPDKALAILNEFLRDDRNLGEAVSRIVWLKPENIQVEAEIELAENVTSTTSVAAVLAAVYAAVEEHVTPSVRRCSTEELQAQGWRSEDIYQGPFLRHGWIPELPPAMNEGRAVTVNLAPLVNTLLAIEGVQSIRYLKTDQSNAITPWIWQGKPGYYPRLWGAKPLEVLAEGKAIRLVAHGIDCSASVAEIQQHISHPAAIVNPPVVLSYGRWRNPAVYHPATERIPPCYGLLQAPSSAEQWQLHQFLLPFEQLLANGCKQLDLLPQLLSFRRTIGDTTWGMQWPIQQPGISNDVFANSSAQIREYLEKRSNDTDKELSLVDYLLGYFGSKAAPHTFDVPANEFLATQQGYLGKVSTLGYQRANIRIDKVSALQQRIAARLGLGGSRTFNENAQLGKLPFYLVEHRALLPVYPDPSYDALQTPEALAQETILGIDYLTVKLPKASTAPLRVGQVVDLVLTADGQEITIRALMIARLNSVAPSFSLAMSNCVELRRYIGEILQPQNTVQWRNCPTWLEDMAFPLVYDNDQSGLLLPDQRRLASALGSPYPALARVGSKLLISPRAASKVEADSAPTESPTLVVEVLQADGLANTLVVRKISGGAFPTVENATKYHWYFDSAEKAETDIFSFAVSVVFNRDQLFALTTDPYAASAWIQQVILDELPSHITMLLHWMPSDPFRAFADAYNRWQNDGAPLGNDSYSLLAMLTLGWLPTGWVGIGNLRIATPEQKLEAVGTNEDQWNADFIEEEGLFHVPPESNP